MSLAAYTAKTWTDYADSPDLSAANVQYMDSGIAAVTAEVLSLEAALPSTYQPISAELSALAGLSSTGYAKRTGAGAWSVVASIPQADVSGLTAALATIPLASATTPLMNGTAAVGTGTTWARADHVHPSDTSKLGVSAQAYDSARLGGVVAASYALASSVPAASSTTPAALGTAAVGTGTTWARADHVHAMPTAAQVGAEPALGNPGTSGYVLSSTTGGVRSWVALPSVPVSSVFGRTGAVVAASGDYSAYYLGISAQAADSAKLGGQLPSYYATAASLGNYLPLSPGSIHSPGSYANTGPTLSIGDLQYGISAFSDAMYLYSNSGTAFLMSRSGTSNAVNVGQIATREWANSVFLGITVQANDSAKLGGQLPAYYASASSLGSYLPLAGGTMTGPIGGFGRGGTDNGKWVSAFANSSGTPYGISNGTNAVQINRYGYSGFTGFVANDSEFYGICNDHQYGAGGQFSIIAGGSGTSIGFFAGAPFTTAGGTRQAPLVGSWSSSMLTLQTALTGTTATMGRAKIGTWALGSEFAEFSCSNLFGTTSYGIIHGNDGSLYLNAAATKGIHFRSNNQGTNISLDVALISSSDIMLYAPTTINKNLTVTERTLTKSIAYYAVTDATATGTTFANAPIINTSIVRIASGPSSTTCKLPEPLSATGMVVHIIAGNNYNFTVYAVSGRLYKKDGSYVNYDVGVTTTSSTWVCLSDLGWYQVA